MCTGMTSCHQISYAPCYPPPPHPLSTPYMIPCPPHPVCCEGQLPPGRWGLLPVTACQNTLPPSTNNAFMTLAP